MKDSTNKMMAMDIAATVRELQTKVEGYEDKLDELGTNEEELASARYCRILERKKNALDEINLLKIKLEQYE